MFSNIGERLVPGKVLVGCFHANGVRAKERDSKACHEAGVDDAIDVVDANDFESEDADEGAVRAADEEVVGARVVSEV